LDSGGADATYTSSDARNGITAYRDSNNGGTFGDAYRITVQAIDTDGIVTDERVVTDDADGTDPGGNADLSNASTPVLQSSSVTDKSNNGKGARFTVEYTTSDGPEFGSVEVQFRNLDSQQATTSPDSGSASGSLDHEPGYGYGDDYIITVRILDRHGALVDERVISETADGPSGGGGGGGGNNGKGKGRG
jgi:hypothetical protein